MAVSVAYLPRGSTAVMDLPACGMSIAMSHCKDRRLLAAEEGTFSNQD